MITEQEVRDVEEGIRQAIANFPDSTELNDYLVKTRDEIIYLEENWDSSGSSVRIKKLKDYVDNIESQISCITNYLDLLKKEKVADTTFYSDTIWDWF